MKELKIGHVVLGMCQTNCYFIYREGAADTIVVDPADSGDRIYASLKQNGFRVVGILLTHGHFDHIMGCKDLKKAIEADQDEVNADTIKIYACETEQDMLMNARLNLSSQVSVPYTMQADVYVKDGDKIPLDDLSCSVITTPGHTLGGCCYYFEKDNVLIAGDTLFFESVGRTDFPNGSASMLVRSVKEKLFVLPDDTKVYPGHGESTTIGHEKKYNPFCV